MLFSGITLYAQGMKDSTNIKKAIEWMEVTEKSGCKQCVKLLNEYFLRSPEIFFKCMRKNEMAFSIWMYHLDEAVFSEEIENENEIKDCRKRFDSLKDKMLAQLKPIAQLHLYKFMARELQEELFLIDYRFVYLKFPETEKSAIIAKIDSTIAAWGKSDGEMYDVYVQKLNEYFLKCDSLFFKSMLDKKQYFNNWLNRLGNAEFWNTAYDDLDKKIITKDLDKLKQKMMTHAKKYLKHPQYASMAGKIFDYLKKVKYTWCD